MFLDNLSKNGINKIEGTLIDYSSTRKNFKCAYVGQFLDEEGVRDNQFGIYGMAIFLTMTSLSHDDRVLKLREECISKLKFWIRSSNDYNFENKQLDANDKSESDKSNIYELRNVVPKICFAYEACNHNSELGEEALILRKHLENARFLNGSYAFLCTDKDQNGKSNIITTALVLRTFSIFHSNDEKTIQTLKYLNEAAGGLKNVFEQLYVYNSIQIVLNQNSLLAKNEFSKFHDNIKKCLRKVFTEVALNPTSFANPINVDFNDFGRTRYYRLYSDLILIEAFALAHPSNLHYLRGSVGDRVLNKVWDCINSTTKKDTTSHRLSFGFFHSLFQIVKIIQTKYEDKLGVLSKIQGAGLRSSLFGIDANKEVFIIIRSLPIIAIWILVYVKFPTIPATVNTAVSFFLARLANIIGLRYDNKQKNKI